MRRGPATTQEILTGGPKPDPQTSSEKVCGALVYLDKSTPVLVQMTPAQFKSHKHVTNRKGQKSILRAQSPGNGKPM